MKNFTQNTEEFIVKKYLDMIMKQRGGKISVQSICQHCYISRQTFYNYFDSIDQLEEKTIQFLVSVEEQPATLQKLLERLDRWKPYIRWMNGPHMCRHLYKSLTEAIAGLDPAPSANQDHSILHSCLAHVILDWLFEDMKQTTEQITKLCTTLLPALER